MLSKRRQRLWRYMIRQLKAKFPPGVPVTVRTVHMKGNSGDSVGIMRLGRMVGILIRVDASSCWQCRVDTLRHEWAHSMEWSAHWTDDSPKKEHGETWGVWYAKIYSYLIEDCWEDMKTRNLLSPENLDDNRNAETVSPCKCRLS